MFNNEKSATSQVFCFVSLFVCFFFFFFGGGGGGWLWCIPNEVMSFEIGNYICDTLHDSHGNTKSEMVNLE